MSSPSNKDSQDFISFSNTPSRQHQDRRQSNSYNRNHSHRMNQSYDQRYSPQNFMRGSDGGYHHQRHQFAHSTPYNKERRPFQRNFRNYTPRHANFQQKQKVEFDVTKYFHDSMLENPWADLEKKHKDQMEEDSDSSTNESEDEITYNDSNVSTKDESSINSNYADSFS